MNNKAGAGFAYPKNEMVWVTTLDSDGKAKYIVTSNKDRTTYYLYGLADGEWKRLGKGKNPAELDEKYVRVN